VVVVKELVVARSIAYSFFTKVLNFRLAISNGVQSFASSITNNQNTRSCFQKRKKEDGKYEP
jgi:hypothetical protein